MCKLFLLFSILPLIDLVVLVKIGGVIGFWSTVGIIVGAALLGTFLVTQQGRGLLSKFQNELAQGKLPTRSGLEAVLIFAGGVLLITPGFITDIIGILFLIPCARYPFVLLLQRWLKRQAQSGKIHFSSAFINPGFDDGVIDGEVISSEVVENDHGAPESKPTPKPEIIPLPEHFPYEGGKTN